MKAIVLAGTILSLFLSVSCTSERSTGLIENLQEDARSVQYNQIRIQLARSYENPYDVPSLVLLSSATSTSNSSLKGGITRASAPNGLTHFTGVDLGAFTDTSQLVVNVTSGATAIQGMRDLYAYASRGDLAWRDSIGGVLVNQPPEYPWLFRSKHGMPPQCDPRDCFRIIAVDGYIYWARTEKDFSDFVLAVLEASSFTRDSIGAVPPKGPGAKKRLPAPSGIRRSEPSNTPPTILLVPSGGAVQ